MPDERGEMTVDVARAITILWMHCRGDRKKVVRDAFVVVDDRLLELMSDNIRLKAENADLRERIGDLLAVPELKIEIPKVGER